MSQLCSIHSKFSCLCVLAALIFVALGPAVDVHSFQWTRLAMLGSLMIASSICDVTKRKIPNDITYPTLLCTVGLMLISLFFVEPSSDDVAPIDSILGCLLCGGVTFIGFHYRCIGGGDVKMAAALGGLMGSIPALSAFLVGHVLAAGTILFCLLVQQGLRHIQPALAFLPPGNSPLNKLLTIPSDHRIKYSTKIPMAGFYSLGALAVLLSQLLTK